MKHPARIVALAALCALATSACGGSSSSGSGQVASAAVPDPRAAAVQKAFDAKPPSQPSPGGLNCKAGGWDTHYERLKKQLQLIREAHVSASHYQHGRGLPCVDITWPGVPNIAKVKDAPSFNAHDYYVYVPLGHYVVDKVGEDQQMAGITYAPIRAHFVESSLGAEMIRAKLATRPQDISDGKALLRKDADGSWVAEL